MPKTSVRYKINGVRFTIYSFVTRTPELIGVLFEPIMTMRVSVMVCEASRSQAGISVENVLTNFKKSKSSAVNIDIWYTQLKNTATHITLYAF